MENGILIYYENKPLTVIAVHRCEFLSLNQILDIYADKFGFSRNLITGCWISVIDITNCVSGIATPVGYAQNDWPQLSAKGS